MLWKVDECAESGSSLGETVKCNDVLTSFPTKLIIWHLRKLQPDGVQASREGKDVLLKNVLKRFLQEQNVNSSEEDGLLRKTLNDLCASKRIRLQQISVV